MVRTNGIPAFALALFLSQLLFASRLSAQSNSGSLRLKVLDPAGLGLESSLELVCEANQVRRSYSTDPAGNLEARSLPFGLYHIHIDHAGFVSYSGAIEIRSSLPARLEVNLAIAPKQTSLDINAETLVDPHRVEVMNRVGSDTLDRASIASPGRSVIALVNSQPGWLMEANGVLHPRGSEYQTQYVVDGVPFTDNRSPAFAPEIEANDVASMGILTASFPAEYGRKLGGVVEVSTVHEARPGLHAKSSVSGGSFDTASGYLMAQYSRGRNTVGLSAEGAFTNRYLDPPVLENSTNRATSVDFAGHYERDFNDRDQLSVSIRHGQTFFQVPNELVQKIAGQRQDRGSFETVGILSYQHIFGANLLGDIRVMSRDDSASLHSNDLATPIVAGEQRGFREGYLKSSLAAHHGIHELKTGVELDYGSIHEQFNDRITDSSQFDAGTPPTFSFLGKGLDREQALYAQDLMRLGPWTLSAGLRWDHYQLIVEKSALSPRLGIAWYWPRADIVVHASYDRIFQTPAFENILLASSPAVSALNPQVLRVPVQPSLGNFYETGLTKGFFDKLRLDLNYYSRFLDNFADDDVLLNTGLSFPIAFRKSRIYGAESKLEIPRWGRISGYLSYSYMVGFAYTPAAGGLFLGSDAAAALANSGKFPVTQDQRNTVSSRLRYQLLPRIWTAFGGTYGSGLPIEFSGTSQDAVQQFGQQILDRVNFDRGRVKPSLALNASVGVDLVKHDNRSARLQADVQNLNNRINLINFAGLFSGTAIAQPRSYMMRLVMEF